MAPAVCSPSCTLSGVRQPARYLVAIDTMLGQHRATLESPWALMHRPLQRRGVSVRAQEPNKTMREFSEKTGKMVSNAGDEVKGAAKQVGRHRNSLLLSCLKSCLPSLS